MNLPKAPVLTVAATTFCLMTSPAFAVEETTPQNMTCQEFMDMNPKSMTPVAFWVVNRNTDFSGGDYVDWYEVETVSVPKMLQECHSTANACIKVICGCGYVEKTPARLRLAAVPRTIC